MNGAALDSAEQNLAPLLCRRAMGDAVNSVGSHR